MLGRSIAASGVADAGCCLPVQDDGEVKIIIETCLEVEIDLGF
jgi:hypothetical protein